MNITKEDLLSRPPVFVDLFGNPEDVFNQFDVRGEDRQRYQILYAMYEYECYSGSAWVFGYDHVDETFFETSGSHCSCYGLEGQWSPESLSLAEIEEFLRRGRKEFTALMGVA